VLFFWNVRRYCHLQCLHLRTLIHFLTVYLCSNLAVSTIGGRELTHVVCVFLSSWGRILETTVTFYWNC
jgi:hypothetical protein